MQHHHLLHFFPFNDGNGKDSGHARIFKSNISATKTVNRIMSNAGEEGDPHVVTWSSKRVDFHGVYDLLLVLYVKYR